MRGAEELPHIIVVGGLLLGVAHQEPYGGAGGLALKDAGEEFHLVGFRPLSGEHTLTGTTASHLALQEVDIYIDAGGHSVNHSSDARAVAFAEGGEPEYVSKSVHSTLNFKL